MHIFHFYFSCGYKKVIKKYILVYEYFQPNKSFWAAKMRDSEFWRKYNEKKIN